MKNIDIIIQESGLCEKFKCTPADIRHSLDLWEEGSTLPKTEELSPVFMKMMGQMRGSLESVNACFEKGIKQKEEYLLEVEIKKANGTYDEWCRELEEAMPDEVMDAFFRAFGKSKPANSNLPGFN